MAKEIFQNAGSWAFKCSGCGRLEGGFPNERDAQIALRLHKLGCKKS
jgi:hypothetical protein